MIEGQSLSQDKPHQRAEDIPGGEHEATTSDGLPDVPWSPILYVEEEGTESQQDGIQTARDRILQRRSVLIDRLLIFDRMADGHQSVNQSPTERESSLLEWARSRSNKALKRKIRQAFQALPAPQRIRLKVLEPRFPGPGAFRTFLP